MAFSFECPHCEMGMEAEFELCGSTCTCPGCGGLFLVPEVDPAAFGLVQEAAAAQEGGARSGAPGAEVVLELKRLQRELAEAAEQHQQLEQQLAEEKARVSKETSAASELRESKAARKKAEVLAGDLGRQCEDLQRRLRDAEKDALAQRQAMASAGERSQKELAAAVRELEECKKSTEQSVREGENLREDLDAAKSENARLDREVAVERERAARELAELRGKFAEVDVEWKRAEEESVGRFRELERLASAMEAERRESAATLAQLDRALKAKEAARLEVEVKVRAVEKERDEARTAARREIETLQNRVHQQQRELERLQQSASESASEAKRLQSDLAGATAEKRTEEPGFAEERGLLLKRLQSLEAERDILREDSRRLERAKAEPDGELQRLRKDLLEAQGAGASAEHALSAERTAMAQKQRVLEQAREAAEERFRNLLGELDGLRVQLEAAQKNVTSQGVQEAGGKGLSPEAEAELRQILAGRDLEIQRLAAQLREVSQVAGGDPASHPLWGVFRGKAALAVCSAALAFGLVLGSFFARPKPGDARLVNTPVDTVSAPGSTADRDLAATATEGTGVAQIPVNAPPPPRGSPPGGDPNPQAGAPPSKAPPPESPEATVASGTSMAGRAGMPSSLPDQFLGIKFGTELSEVSGISLWKETAGKRHRKAELLGSEVEAVLTADSKGRLIMGSYVRVAYRQPDSLTPFLEWAVNVQDAVSALYGEPIRVHSVEGATEAAEVVRKISAGEDYYQASWERESEDGVIDMSIRVFNERSVVFRMEYRARRLYVAYMSEQAGKDAQRDEVRDDAAKSASKDASKDGGAPSKVE